MCTAQLDTAVMTQELAAAYAQQETKDPFRKSETELKLFLKQCFHNIQLTQFDGTFS